MPSSERTWLEGVFKAGVVGDRPDWAVVQWFAQDRYGRLAVFEAVGQPILRAVFHDLDTYLAVKEALFQLPRETQATVFIQGTRRQTAWSRGVAERGIYVFDSWEGRDWQKGYRLLASPASPLRAEQLSEPLLGWFSMLRLPRADFRLAREQPLDLAGKDLDWVGFGDEPRQIGRPRR